MSTLSRFTQWLEDNLLDELSALLQGERIEDSEINSFKEFGDFATNRQPHIRLAIVLQAAFQEFCSNKRYGVDSYLGRRIRHGTLKGVMLNQLQAIFQNQKYTPILEIRTANVLINDWLAAYEHSIELWGKEAFQIRSKQKPKGAILVDVTSPEKLETTRTALRDIRNIFTETHSLAMVNLAIIEWCWRLIEKDLSIIRMSIDFGRTHWGVLSRIDLRDACPDEQKALATELCREVNSLTDEKFRQLARWFTKPTNLAPSTSLSLLLDAVMHEVKEHFRNYQPKIERSGLSDIELVGMYYHHIYDFLYVVIYNAAKHGARTGVLRQNITLSDGAENTRRLEIVISSEIARGDSIDAVRANIDGAVAGSIEDAMVVEGRSGVKKLLRLCADVREIEDIHPSYEDGFVNFHCVMNLPVA